MNNKLLRGSLDSIILKLLEEEGEMYGYEITQRVKSITQGQFNITEGALYPALHRLEAQEILESSSKMVSNRVRKYYCISKQSEGKAKERMEDIALFIENLQRIMKHKKQLDLT